MRKQLISIIGLAFAVCSCTQIEQAVQAPLKMIIETVKAKVNQTGDAYKFGYRHVAIADVYENKVAGIYLHHKAS